MKKDFKTLLLLFVLLLPSFALISCGDDDDEPESTYSDYFMEVSSVEGGGLSVQQCSSLKAELNSELTQYYWKAIDRNQAIYYFDDEVREAMDGFSDGLSGISGTLSITFSLKDSRSGKTIKSSTLNITRDGCSLR